MSSQAANVLKANPWNSGNLGAKVYLLFAGCMLLNIVIAYFVFPELKGRTPAEVDEMFEARLPARMFKGIVRSFSVAVF
jgi:hypothetical protein